MKCEEKEGETPSSSSSSSLAAVMELNDTKAGMEGLDKERINAVIEEASRGSKFYAAKMRAQERISRQVEDMKGRLSRLPEAEVARARQEADREADGLRAARDISRTIVHVDMDAFYAAVEMRDDPALKEVPMAVGGMGMLSTSNYKARKFGVRAGMPGFIGKKLCPDLVIVRCNFAKYRADSEKIRGVFVQYDPGFVMMSLDEGYLDLTDYLETAKGAVQTAEEVVGEIRGKIKESTGGLTASAGIAPNSRLAKVCSDMNKPDGQFRLGPDEGEVMRFVEGLPIRKISGIGNVTEQMLRAVGVSTCKDLLEKRGELRLLFSEISHASFLRIALGIGHTTLDGYAESVRKSMSNETTFRDTSNPEELFKICADLSKDLSEDLEAKELMGRSVTLKVKTDGFQVKTRVKNLLEHTADASVIGSAARGLLRQFMEEMRPLTLRLMGVRMSEFRSEEESGGSGGVAAKRQKTLHSFLRSCSTKEKKKMGSVFECPICCGDVEASSELAFNAHLDRCLKEQEHVVEQEQSEQSKQNVQHGKSNGEHNGEASKPDVQHVDDKSEQSKQYVEHGDVTPSTSHHVVCPVCNERIAAGSDDDMLVNSHVDECLNRQLLKSEKRRRLGEDDGIDRDRQDRPPSKRVKSSNGSRGIESYLTKGLGSR